MENNEKANETNETNETDETDETEADFLLNQSLLLLSLMIQSNEMK